MKYIKLFENINFYNGYTSSFTDDSINYNLEGKKYTLDELLNLFNKYKNIFLNDFNINKLKEIIKNELDDNLYKKLNLKSFFNILKIKYNLSEEDSVDFFNDYIDSIPRRYRKIYNGDFSDYEKPEFKKLKKIKSDIKNKNSYILLDKESPALFEELTKMVLWVKENKKKILISFDGRDTGGKGSISRFILKNFFAAPLGRNIIYKDFGIPTRWQQINWFHRYKKELPKEGQIVLFDRSWYNRAVNDPVMGYCTEKQYEKFMEDVIPFEKELIDNDIIYIKFWLNIEKDTQLSRFNQRKSSPIKFWKFSENDLKAVEKWDEFTPYIERMFKDTSTSFSPWVIVNMDDKPLGWLNSLRYILKNVPYENKNKKILETYPEVIQVIN